jgi:hypothetical protein
MAIDKIVRNIVEDNAVTQPKIAAGAVDNTAIDKTIVTGLSELTSVADNDELIIYDASADALKRIDKSNTTGLDFPTYTSVSPTTSQTVDGGNITFTITGSGFTAGTNARLISNTGVRLNFDTVTRTNTTTISATIARSSLLVAQSPYDIQVINGEGLSVIGANQITVDNVPVFVTSSGSLGTVTEGDAVDIEVIARDPDSSSAVTFELQSGSLPAGLSLVNQSGDSCRIQGTASAVSADTTSNFTLRAFDSASNTTSRAFSITIEDFSMNGLRFDDGSSDYLNRTPSSASSRTTWTWSAWIKRSNITGGQMALFGAKQDSSNDTGIWFESDESLKFFNNIAGTVKQIRTNRLFRDPSAWYHIVAVWDSSNGTAGDRMKLYVNGTEETSFQTDDNPGSSDNSTINNTQIHQIGRVDSTYYFDGYMSEINFVDGTALTPTSFGETDSNGVWIPKAYSGSFGTNGFYLPFDDGADLGDDHSGNTNDFTENNITSIDKVEDTPQNNYATLNPLFPAGGTLTFSEGNTSISAPNDGNWKTTLATMASENGKWYMEFKSGGNYAMVGVCDFNITSRGIDGDNFGTKTTISAYGYGYYNGDGTVRYEGGTELSFGATYGNGDIIGIALDCDNDKLYFSKNGTWQNSGDPTSGATGTGAVSLDTTAGRFWGFAFSIYQTNDRFANFGNPAFSISSGNTDGNGYGSFEYAVPSGFYALNTKNLAEYG